MEVPVFINSWNRMKLKVSVEEEEGHSHLYRCFLPVVLTIENMAKGLESIDRDTRAAPAH